MMFFAFIRLISFYSGITVQQLMENNGNSKPIKIGQGVAEKGLKFN